MKKVFQTVSVLGFMGIVVSTAVVATIAKGVQRVCVKS